MGSYEQPNKQTEQLMCQLQVPYTRFEGIRIIRLDFEYSFMVLQVGTLDQLVGLSDDLGKLDAYVEQCTRKVANYLGEVLEDQRDKLQENLMANNSKS